MGMFDYVRSDIALPDGWSGEMQSKDFECIMTTLLITGDGRLQVERFDHYTVPQAERPYPDADGLLGLCGSWGRKNRHWEYMNFHGDFYFGGIEDSKNDFWVASERHTGGGFWAKRYISHDYVARFTDGKLVAITIDAPNSSPKDTKHV